MEAVGLGLSFPVVEVERAVAAAGTVVGRGAGEAEEEAGGGGGVEEGVTEAQVLAVMQERDIMVRL